MPFLPEIPNGNGQVINTTQFLGLNRGLSISDGEMADMLNMSSDDLPVLSTRKARGVPAFSHNAVIGTDLTGQVDGMLGTDKLVVCHDGKVYCDGVEVPLELSTEAGMREKKLVSMGAYVCIWPDKVYFNTEDWSDRGSMEAAYESSGSVSSRQSLILELENGLVVQLAVKNDSVAACGVWSCPEFFEEFEDACD